MTLLAVIFTALAEISACHADSAPILNTVGITAPGQFTPPATVPGQSGWLEVPQFHQATNLCVPTSASMVLSYFHQDYPPRELKVWSRGISRCRSLNLDRRPQYRFARYS